MYSCLRLGDKIIQVFVGNATQPVYVHQEVIARSSQFFYKALTGEFQEKDGTVRLFGEELEQFKMYTQWLYSGLIAMHTGDSDEDKNGPEPLLRLQSLCLVDLYILGDVVQDDRFRNAVIDALLKGMDHYKCLLAFLVDKIELHLPCSSPLYKLVVDIWATRDDVGLYLGPTKGTDIANGSQAFWVNVAKALTLRCMGNSTPQPSFENRCHYHIHADGKDCTKVRIIIDIAWLLLTCFMIPSVSKKRARTKVRVEDRKSQPVTSFRF
jgi:hypothetical protein